MAVDVLLFCAALCSFVSTVFSAGRLLGGSDPVPLFVQIPIMLLLVACNSLSIAKTFASSLLPGHFKRVACTPVFWIVTVLNLLNYGTSVLTMSAGLERGTMVVLDAFIMSCSFQILFSVDSFEVRPRRHIYALIACAMLHAAITFVATLFDASDGGDITMFTLSDLVMTRRGIQRTAASQLGILAIPIFSAMRRDPHHLRYFVVSENVLTRMTGIYIPARRSSLHARSVRIHPGDDDANGSENAKSPSPVGSAGSLTHTMFAVGVAKVLASRTRRARESLTSPEPASPIASVSARCQPPSSMAGAEAKWVRSGMPSKGDNGAAGSDAKTVSVHSGLPATSQKPRGRVFWCDVILVLLCPVYLSHYVIEHFAGSSFMSIPVSWVMFSTIAMLSGGTVWRNVDWAVLRTLVKVTEVQIIAVFITAGAVTAFLFEVGAEGFSEQHGQFVISFWCTIMYFLLQDALVSVPRRTRVVVGLLFLVVNGANMLLDTFFDGGTPTVFRLGDTDVTVQDFNKSMRTSIFTMSLRSVLTALRNECTPATRTVYMFIRRRPLWTPSTGSVFSIQNSSFLLSGAGGSAVQRLRRASVT